MHNNSFKETLVEIFAPTNNNKFQGSWYIWYFCAEIYVYSNIQETLNVESEYLNLISMSFLSDNEDNITVDWYDL